TASSFMELSEDSDFQELDNVGEELYLVANDLLGWNSSVVTAAEGEIEVLRQTPGGPFRLLPPHQMEYPEFVGKELFYKDDTRSFLVTAQTDPVVAWSTASVAHPGMFTPWTLHSTPQEVCLKHTYEFTGYKFDVFYHPYMCEFIRRLNRYDIDGLLKW